LNTTPPAWARRVDWILLIGTIGMGVVELTDGFATHIAGVRFSIQSTSRLLTWLALLAIVRHAIWRRPSLLDHLHARGWLVRDEAWCTALGPPGPREIGLAIAFFALLVGAALHVQVLAPLSVPDYGDPLFSTWRMAWVTHTVVRHPLQLFNANIFYPEPGTLAYSDSVIVPSLFAAPFFWIGIPQIAVYHVVLLTAYVSSGVTLFFLVSRLTGSRPAGIVAGTIFALYPFRFEHYSHLELQMTMWMPLGLMALHRIVQQPSRSRGASLGVLMGLQVLSSLYFGIYFSLYLGAAFLGLILFSRARPAGPRLAALLISGAIAAAAAAPLAPPYLMNRDRLGERSEAENVVYSARLADYVSVHPRSMLYGSRLPIGPAERSLFPGITPVVLAAIAIVPPLNTVRATYAMLAFVAFDASLGWNAELYPALYHWLTPLHALRVPARFSILFGLSLAVLAGLAVARLGRRWSTRNNAILAAALVVLVFVEYRPALALQPAWRNLPSVYQPLVGRAPAVVAVFPMSKETSDNDAKYMYFSTWHWHRLVNGYSGNFPPSYIELVAWMRQFPSREAIEYLARRHVEYVVVHGEFTRPADYDTQVPLLDANPSLELVGVFPAEPRPSRLYRMRAYRP
jgi:hypothetical protein